jgi:hypothetical protein
MKLDHFTAQMEHNAETIRLLIRDVPDEQARWKPSPTSWSVLEVVNHLYDEEREDFRVRLDIMLHRTDEPLPKLDPEGCVVERRYNERDLKNSLDNFLRERQESLRWLRTLKSPEWDAVYKTTQLKMTARDMFASWVVHDLLHMRQLVKLQWLYTIRELEPCKVDYAGSW